jgi:hypothetical protein
MCLVIARFQDLLPNPRSLEPTLHNSNHHAVDLTVGTQKNTGHGMMWKLVYNML